MNYASRFPPSFYDNALAFGLSLFVLTMLSGICLAMIAGMLFEARHRRYIDRTLRNPIDRADRNPGASVMGLYRFKLICLLTTILCLTGPRTATLLLWREQPYSTILVFFFVERVFSWTAAVPFFAFVGTHILSGQAVGHVLMTYPQSITLRPRWSEAKDKVQIVIWSAVIALGVTMYRMGVG